MRSPRLRVVVVLALAGCRQVAGIEPLAPPPDATDATRDGDVIEGGLGCRCPGCTVLALDPYKPQSLVVMGGTVYWLDPQGPERGQHPSAESSVIGTGRVMSVSTNGGKTTELASDLDFPLSIATDGQSLYFYETLLGSIDKIALDGTTHETQVQRIVTGLTFPASSDWTAPEINAGAMGAPLSCPGTSLLAVAGGEIYFESSYVPDCGVDTLYAIRHVSTDGGAIKELVGTLSLKNAELDDLPDDGVTEMPQVDALALGIEGGSLYWMNSDYGIGCLASNVSLWKAPLAGGRPFLVTTSMGEPTNFVVAGTRIYTVDYQNNDVESYSTSGGADGPPISDQQAPWTLATDAEFVYWSTFGGTANTGVIAKLPIGGSAVTTLASGLAAPAALAVDDTNVYWVDTVCGAILKAPKNP